jgi:branched-chain amino acid transport system substrate-binding protein
MEEEMRKRSRSILLPLVVVLALVIAACDGDGASDTTEAPTDTTAAPTDTTAAPTDTTAAPTDTTAAPTDTTAAPSGETIKIGALTDLTAFTPWAVNARDGMELAAQEINDAGGVDGRMIEIVVQDSANDADAGIDGFERLVEDGVVAIGGTISSTVAAAVAPLAEELEMPYLLVKAGTEVALTADSRYTFRTCLPAAPMDAAPVLQYAQEQGISNVGVIVADYAWGQSFSAAVQATFEGSGVDYGEIQVAPVPPDTDFTPFVRALADAGAEMVVATGHPPGSSAILGLAVDLIGDVPVTGSWIPPDLAVVPQPDVAIGNYADFACADYTGDGYADLAARYLEFSENGLMSDDAVAGHGIVTMVAEAVGEIGDDPVAIAEYLHQNSFDLEGYAHTVSWTEWGELAEAQPIFFRITEGPAPEGLNETGDWWMEVLTRSEPLEPYAPGS